MLHRTSAHQERRFRTCKARPSVATRTARDRESSTKIARSDSSSRLIHMMPISRHPSPSAATWVALSQVRRDAVGEVVGGAPREVDAVGQVVARLGGDDGVNEQAGLC